MYISYIDGIRALAVVSVIIYHLNPDWMPGGFCGVDVFFVVSGFVVSLSLDKHKDLKIYTFLSIFYSRRIKRIIPALIFCLLATSLIAVLFTPEGNLSTANAKTAFFAFFGLSNIILATGNNDYFSPTTEYNPFTHTWSLGVEEQFYFAFPYLFYFWTMTRKPHYRKISTALFIVFLAASLGAAFYYSATNKVWEYYMIFSRFWQLAVGILLYQFIKSAYEPRLHKYQKTFTAISWVALALVMIGFIVSDEKSFPIPWAFFAVVGTFGLLFSLHYLKGGFVMKLLSSKPFTYTGKLSYSLYLWHWVVVVMFHWTIGLHTPAQYVLALVVMIVLSILSYYLVETSLRFSKTVSNAPRIAVIVVGIALIFASAELSEHIFKNYYNYTLSQTKEKEVWYPYSYTQKLDQGECQLAETYDGFHGGLKLGIQCRDEEAKQERSVYVLGDSHAGAYNSLLKRYTAETGERTILYTLGGCGDTLNKPFSEHADHCENFLKQTLADIEKIAKPNDVLLLSSLKLERFCNQWVLYDEEQAKANMVSEAKVNLRKAAIEENVKEFKGVSEKGVRVVFEAPKPIFRSPVYRCSDWFNKSNPICSRGIEIDKDYLLEYRKPVMDVIDNTIAGIEGSMMYDPLPVLCPDEKCSPLDKDGKPLFFDGDHVSGHGNMVLFGDFKTFVSEIR